VFCGLSSNNDGKSSEEQSVSVTEDAVQSSKESAIERDREVGSVTGR